MAGRGWGEGMAMRVRSQTAGRGILDDNHFAAVVSITEMSSHR
jgi:hypothetical protein